MSASTQPVILTDETFRQRVLDAQGVVLVDFWATWCPPCKAIAPTIDQLAAGFAGRATIGKVDVDDNKQFARQLEVSSIPTLILFRDGQEVQRFVGITSRDVLGKAIEEALAVAA